MCYGVPMNSTICHSCNTLADEDDVEVLFYFFSYFTLHLLAVKG
jgi:hypothetical protein